MFTLRLCRTRSTNRYWLYEDCHPLHQVKVFHDNKLSTFQRVVKAIQSTSIVQIRRVRYFTLPYDLCQITEKLYLSKKSAFFLYTRPTLGFILLFLLPHFMHNWRIFFCSIRASVFNGPLTIICTLISKPLRCLLQKCRDETSGVFLPISKLEMITPL